MGIAEQLRGFANFSRIFGGQGDAPGHVLAESASESGVLGDKVREAEPVSVGGSEITGGWDKIPVIAEEHLAWMTGGQPERYGNPLNYAIERWGGSLGSDRLKVLVVGDDTGEDIPAQLRISQRVGSITVVDSPERLNKEDEGEGVYKIALDLNRDNLPRGPYDLVIAFGSLQRVRELKPLFERIMAELKSGGLLVFRDYVGPDRMQFSESQMGLANGLLKLLPERLRRDLNGDCRQEQKRPDRHWQVRLDPDRAVHSQEILSELNSRLKVLEFQPLGGTLLAPMLEGITANFVGEDAEADNAIRSIIRAEMVLIDGGLLTSDTCFAIARRP